MTRRTQPAQGASIVQGPEGEAVVCCVGSRFGAAAADGVTVERDEASRRGPVVVVWLDAFDRHLVSLQTGMDDIPAKRQRNPPPPPPAPALPVKRKRIDDERNKAYLPAGGEPPRQPPLTGGIALEGEQRTASLVGSLLLLGPRGRHR